MAVDRPVSIVLLYFKIIKKQIEVAFFISRGFDVADTDDEL